MSCSKRYVQIRYLKTYMQPFCHGAKTKGDNSLKSHFSRHVEETKSKLGSDHSIGLTQSFFVVYAMYPEGWSVSWNYPRPEVQLVAKFF